MVATSPLKAGTKGESTLASPRPASVREVDGYERSVAGVRIEVVRTGRGTRATEVSSRADHGVIGTAVDVGFPMLSKTELGEHVYEEDLDPDSNVLEVLVGRLRKKLDPGKALKPIDTIRGQGYRFRLPRSA